MRQNHVDRCAQVKAEMCGDVYEAVAMAANYLGYVTILGTKNVDSPFRMVERGQWFGTVKHFHTDGHAIRGEQLKRTLVVLELHAPVTFHTFLTRKPLVFRGINSSPVQTRD